MSILTAVQVADYWIGAGGPRNRAVEWVAISMGESAMQPDVVSPAGAIGLWQIMPFNAAPNGATVSELYNPAINARVAVAMSGGGTNCAAWDSAYRNISASGRYTFLAWPETGSADYNYLPVAQAQLAGHGLSGITSPGNPGIDNTIAASAKQWKDMGASAIPAISRQVQAATKAVSATYKRGWRP